MAEPTAAAVAYTDLDSWINMSYASEDWQEQMNRVTSTHPKVWILLSTSAGYKGA